MFLHCYSEGIPVFRSIYLGLFAKAKDQTELKVTSPQGSSLSEGLEDDSEIQQKVEKIGSPGESP
jgi:hypothetical protein